MRRKPDDSGYSVIYPEVKAEPESSLGLVGCHCSVRVYSLWPSLLFGLYFCSKSFIFDCHYGNCEIQHRNERFIIFIKVRGEAGFPLFLWIPRELYIS